MGKVIIFGNQKGGVGKTTLTVLAATALSQKPHNKKVLVIDADTQQSLIKSRNEDLLDDSEVSPSYKILSCHNNPKKLHEVLAASTKSYDYIFVDVAGKLDDETKRLLFYTDVLAIPFQAGNYGLDSTIDYIKFAIKASKTKEKNGFAPIQIVGFVNMYIKGRKEHRYIEEELEDLADHIDIMDKNLGFYSLFMAADTIGTVYSTKNKGTAENNFRNWFNEFKKFL